MRRAATEMARAAVLAAFATRRLDTLVALTTPATASQAVMRRLGFRYETDILHAGLPHVLFRLRRGDDRTGG